MHDEPSSHPAELNEFESQLAALVPRAALNRDQLLFAAGRRAGRRLLLANRLLSAASLALACTVAVLVAERYEWGTPSIASRMNPDELSPKSHAPYAATPAGLTAQSQAVSVAAGPSSNFRLLHSIDFGRGVFAEPFVDKHRDASSDDSPNRPLPRVLMPRDLEEVWGHL